MEPLNLDLLKSVLIEAHGNQVFIPEAKGFSLAEGPNRVFPRKNLSPAVQTAEAELKCYT